VRLGARY
jgi:hypothetical protein